LVIAYWENRERH